MMKKIIKAIICVFVITIILCTCYCIKQINNMKWKSDKNYYSFIVEQGDIVDYSVFMRPFGEYHKLNAIDYETREKIAQYMRNNNLKLSEGEQYFDRLDYTYEELINHYFRFEKIKVKK